MVWAFIGLGLAVLLARRSRRLLIAGQRYSIVTASDCLPSPSPTNGPGALFGPFADTGQAASVLSAYAVVFLLFSTTTFLEETWHDPPAYGRRLAGLDRGASASMKVDGVARTSRAGGRCRR